MMTYLTVLEKQIPQLWTCKICRRQFIWLILNEGLRTRCWMTFLERKYIKWYQVLYFFAKFLIKFQLWKSMPIIFHFFEKLLVLTTFRKGNLVRMSSITLSGRLLSTSAEVKVVVFPIWKRNIKQLLQQESTENKKEHNM